MSAPTIDTTPSRSVQPPTRPRRGTRAVARLAGASYLLMFALAILANFLVLEGLVVDGDAAATTRNIAEAPAVLAAGISAFLVILALDVVLAWALYVVFSPAGRRTALAMAWFRVGYSLGLGIALAFLVQALVTATAGPPGDGTRAAATMAAVEAFQRTWLVALVLFGAHLILLGLLVARCAFAPRALGFLLAFAGAAYIADTAAHFTLPDYASVAGLFVALVALPSMIGEGWLGFWLLLTRRLDERTSGE